MKRRDLVRNTILSVAALSVGGKLQAAEQCQLTAEQTEGPFYPERGQDDTNTDLTQVEGRRQKAKGKVVILNGVVRDEKCRLVGGALVEIWQAASTGKYNHSRDPNPAPLDPNFQYWGRAITNKKGEFSFKTIKPGAYPATSTWVRPPHIHVKVHLRGYEELTTQLYFKDEVELNERDRILKSLTQTERDNVIVDFKLKNNKPPEGDCTLFIKGY
ncbi:protocatechuate 3,4-dioxygenase [Bacteriovoracaceae bacterium]|nr:protocatechuate 3,4-dioxygenase [Bacteriovoracaceae bacterium]